MQKLLPPLLTVALLLLMFVVDRFVPIAHVVPAPYNKLGALLIVAGLGAGMAARIAFLRVHTNIHTFREPGTLLTDGVFRFSRNPMYVGMALVLLGAALLFGSLSPLFLVVAFVVISDRWYIAFEEAWLERKFGDSYRAYKEHTRRWL